MTRDDRQSRPLELYIHIPFCEKKCNYCDFLSFRALPQLHREYAAQLCREIRTAGKGMEDYRVVTIFIGGGTPSVFEPLLIRQIMEAVGESFQAAPEAEVTIEVNPGTLLKNKLAVYRDCGINRLSIGLQSADNRELAWLGRIHSYEDFLKTFQYARMEGFSNISVDLMSGIPGQTLESWKNTLKKVTMLKPEHISAYSLIVEEGTPFWEVYGPKELGQGRTKGEAGVRPAAGWPALPDEDMEYKIYSFTRTYLAGQGYGRYEISNYSRPGWECRHNIGYWTEVPYLGLGLGASSYVAGERFRNESDIERYMALDFSAGDGGEALEALHGPVQKLSREERMEEFMFLGLRMVQGVSELDFAAMFGVKLTSVYGPVLERLKKDGLVKQEGTRIALTEWGMDVSNFVLSEFLL